ncbi:MAG: C-GCAxxG-C-C family protein [Candidatus Thorarchaeota archaeon]
MMKPTEKALQYFSSDYNCAQAVLSAVTEDNEQKLNQIPHIAAAFGGGIIGRGEICGAVSGALMAIGVLNGRIYTDIIEQKAKTKEDSEKFYEEFEKIFGHNTCNGLIGIDRRDPVARQQAVDAGLYKKNCPKFVEEAVRIVFEIFKDRI